jgi:hypothetical protein
MQSSMSMSPQGQSQGMAMPNAYAHGGNVRKGKMILAHFNKHELDEMDKIQGVVHRCKKTGVKSYPGLESMLKNPHLMQAVHHHSRQHHAHGGMASPHMSRHDADEFRSHGVHGDTEAAFIGPHTYSFYHAVAKPGTVVNGHDGHPQFFSLSGALGGLWNTVRGGASQLGNTIAGGASQLGSTLASGASRLGNTIREGASHAAPYVGALGKSFLPAAQQALSGVVSQRFGPAGGAIVNGLGSLADKGFDALEDMGDAQDQARARTLGEGVQSAMNARASGASPMQSFGAGLNQVGSRFSGAVGGGMQGLGSSLQSGAGLKDTARNTAMGAYTGGGGAQGLMNQAKNAYSQYASGASPSQIGSSAAMNAYNSLRNSQPTLESMRNQDASNQLPYANQYA